MRILRNFVCCVAALLIAAPALPAFQAEQSAGTSTKAAKKTKSAAGANAASPETGTGAVETPQTPKAAKAKSTGSAQRAMPAASDAEIAAAKASGKVWVNTETGVFHTGGRWYGATKQGKFMTEEEALRSGYRSAKNKQ